MELGGVVTINCEKTGYKAEIEFKLKVSAEICDNILAYLHEIIEIW